ncbi:MAG: hypothetical protein ABIH03_15525, partial [Pseudomonadota bacterium]
MSRFQLWRGAGDLASRVREHARTEAWRPAATVATLIVLCAALIARPAPAGLQEAGKRVIAVAVLAIGLWCSEALP